MIDPKLLRQSTAEVAQNLARRGFAFDTENYLALEERRKALQVETEALRGERNASAKSIGKSKAQGEDIEPLLAAVKDLGDKLMPRLATHPNSLPSLICFIPLKNIQQNCSRKTDPAMKQERDKMKKSLVFSLLNLAKREESQTIIR